MSLKPKPSGAEFKKKQKLKDVKNVNIVKKIRKISSFFSRTPKNAECEIVSDNISYSENSPSVSSVAPELEEIACETDLAQAVYENSSEKVDLESTPDVVFSSDAALWKVSQQLRDYVCAKGVIQNKDLDFGQSKRQYPDKVRFLSKNLFSRKLQNGKKRDRIWLVYSPSKVCVFCVPCMVFGQPDKSGAFSTGFNDWKNANSRLLEHENSDTHSTNLRKLKLRSSSKGRADDKLTEAFQQEVHYCREVLKRVVAAVKYLSVQGHEHLDNLDRGNFLRLLKFLAEFDPFVAEHLKQYGDKGSGSISYIFKTTYEELIALMAGKALNKIFEEVRKDKYFGIVVDSSPDISHVDQLTFVLRYVGTDGAPIERFICFVPNVGHKAEEIVNTLLELFKKFELDISNCRGQSYDNASNMSGVYKRVQARIKELSPLADFVPRSAHSLNLTGVCAAQSCVEAVSFFGLLQELYNFFSVSTHR